MEQYIQISKINDFVFCPKSLYFHTLYENFNDKEYKDVPQVTGTIAHENIESGRYSTRKDCIQGLPVYSEKYGLAGKIDIYLSSEATLIERKYKVKRIFDGYRYQLYAQKICLEEMGYPIKKMFVHSLSDNKRYEIESPNKEELAEFYDVINKINSFSINDRVRKNKQKCLNCIYRELCV